MTDIDGRINQNIPEILNKSKNIAIVGLSQKPERQSHKVGLYIKNAGYNIFPVNPNYDSVLGLKCYKSLSDIPEPIDIVDIFRKSEDVLPIVQEAVKINAKTIWMQLGIKNEQAAKLALDAGMQVIMDHCIKIEHSNL
ncbi:MAG: CoA-binding protein [Calditrichaceae bacterium]